MRKIDIFNEVLQQHDEPTVLATNAHPGVVKMDQWFKQVGRELTDSYEIPESIVIVNTLARDLSIANMPEIMRAEFCSATAFNQHPDRVIKVVEGPDRNLPLTQVSLMRLIELRDSDPSRRLADGLGGRYFAVAALADVSPNGFQSGAAIAAPRICVWPSPAVGTSVNLRAYIRRNLLVELTDTSYCPFPSHLVILGLKWYFKMDRLGSDDPETVAAREAYRNGVASHVSYSAAHEGSPMSSWDPS
jgi:hypothetical protein